MTTIPMTPDEIDYDLAEELILNNRHDDILAAIDEGRLHVDESLGGSNETLLHLAVQYSAVELIEGLLERDAYADVETTSNITPLHIAAGNGSVYIAEMLLRAGADIDAPDAEGQTPLHRAVTEGHHDMVEFLLEAGANAELDDVHFDAPLAVAMMQGDATMCAMLQDYVMPPRPYLDSALTRDDVVAKNDAGLSALDANLTWFRFDKVIKLLEANGEALTKQDLMQLGKDGITYFERGVRCGEAALLMQVLERAGEQLTAHDLLHDDGTATPLLNALAKNRGIATIFTQENWLGQTVPDLRRVLGALPDEAKEQVPNVHVLSAELARQESQAKRVQGVW